MKSELIKKEAKEVKAFVEKNKKLPKFCTIGGSEYSIYSTAYLMAKLLNAPKATSISAKAIRAPSNKYNGKINKKVMVDGYMNMNQRFVAYCEKHKRAPAYISIGNDKVSFELYFYCLAKIVNYYAENKTRPNYCIMDSKDLSNNGGSMQNSASNSASGNKKPSTSTSNCVNPYKSKPHPTKHGCNQLAQNNSYYCGVSALHKVLYKFGITKYTQGDLAKVAGTTTSGTSHQGIETAVAWVSKQTGVKLSCKWYNFSELGFEKLAKLICKQNKDCIVHLLYRGKYGHYETINEINTKNSTIKVINSLGNKCGSCYCGYVEERSFNMEKSYIAGISQKSICIITRE